MFLSLNSRLSPSARGQLYLAAVPLAVMVIARAMSEIEDLIADKISELAQLDAAVAARRQRLEHAIPTIRIPEDTGGAAGPLVDHWGPDDEGKPPCERPGCPRPSSTLTPSGVPVCADHDPAVRLS